MRSVSYPVGKTASVAIWYHTSSFWVVAIFYHCPIYNLATIDYNIFLSFLLSLCCPQTFSSFSGCSPLGCTDWLSPHAEHSCVAYVEADFFFVKKKKEQKCTYQSRKFWESRKADALPPSLALLKYLSQALQHPNAGEDSVGSLIKGSVRAGDDPALRLFRLDHQITGIRLSQLWVLSPGVQEADWHRAERGISCVCRAGAGSTEPAHLQCQYLLSYIPNPGTAAFPCIHWLWIFLPSFKGTVPIYFATHALGGTGLWDCILLC